MTKEVLDVVSPSDEVIGTADREECHREELRHRGIHVFLFNNKGQIYMQKRSDSKDIFPGLLECSLTGHVLSDESYLAAAVRELKEELGVDLPESYFEEKFKFKMRSENEHEIIVHFRVEFNGELNLDKEEVESGEFVDFEKAKEQIKENSKNFHPATAIALEHY